jgi:arylsulfatase A-like enzyme
LSFFRRRKAAEALPGFHDRPAPPFDDLGNFIMVVLDSCRFDTFIQAAPKVITRLGSPDQRYSYASWTAPSHYNLLMGLMPHTSPPGVFASEYYKKDFVLFNRRLGAREIEFKSLVPRLYLPDYLRDTLGYRTHAMVSLPVLNSFTPLNHGFDSFRLMDRHNDMNAMLDLMTFPPDRPSFYLLNTGETHYPYATPDEPENEWPRISGVHGVFKHLDDHALSGGDHEDRFFDECQMKALRERQVNAVRWLDRVFERLFDIVPKNTWITVTSDHGELFGEGGYFGHGPVFHEKVFQVPFLEGGLR